MSGKFFQIDRDVFRHVGKLGLNPAVSYLVMACGTGANNRTTSWSVNAIEKYTGIGRSLARRAIDALVEAGVVVTMRGGKKPLYTLKSAESILGLQRKPQKAGHANTPWIWLPNSLIVGAAMEDTPIERLRGLQDIRSLRQFVEMYDHHNLVENGGLHWRHIRRNYKRELITTRGRWHIWKFSVHGSTVWLDTPIGAEFRKGIRNKEGIDLGAEEFWDSWRALVGLGLIECVPHLIEADTDEAALIFACPHDHEAGTPAEKALGDAARNAAVSMLESSLTHRLDTDDEIMAVPARFPKVEMVGIYRLRYRPQTAKTAAWIAKSAEYKDWCELYSSLSQGLDVTVL